MAENNHGKKVVESFTIRETDEVVRAGDCVAIRPSMDDDEENLSLARVEKLETCCECRGVAAQVRWYYQPWQTKPGSRTFHGKKELHLSDRIDTRSAYTFEAKCVVHTLKEYSKLSKARIEDFFCRLEYKVDSATFMPDQLSVYCICEMPYNPDIPMISCPGCKERFHPSCVNVDIKQDKNLDSFVCPICVPNVHAPSLNNKRKNISMTSPSVIPGVPRDSATIEEGDVAENDEECNSWCSSSESFTS